MVTLFRQHQAAPLSCWHWNDFDLVDRRGQA